VLPMFGREVVERQQPLAALGQAQRPKELERENSRLKRAVADLTLEKLVLKEAAEGNW